MVLTAIQKQCSRLQPEHNVTRCVEHTKKLEEDAAPRDVGDVESGETVVGHCETDALRP